MKTSETGLPQSKALFMTCSATSPTELASLMTMATASERRWSMKPSTTTTSIASTGTTSTASDTKTFAMTAEATDLQRHGNRLFHHKPYLRPARQERRWQRRPPCPANPRWPQFCLRHNGNMTSDGNRTIQYSPFDKPTLITKGSQSIAYQYGATAVVLNGSTPSTPPTRCTPKPMAVLNGLKPKRTQRQKTASITTSISAIYC